MSNTKTQDKKAVPGPILAQAIQEAYNKGWKDGTEYAIASYRSQIGELVDEYRKKIKMNEEQK